MRVSGVTREGFGNRCEFRARFGQNQRVRCEMMLETLIYFRIWAVTVRFARFGCSKLFPEFSRRRKLMPTKKPAELRSSSTGLCQQGWRVAHRREHGACFKGSAKKEVRRQGGVPRRLGGGGSGIECRILLSRGLKQSDGSRGTSKSLKRIIGQDLFWSP